MLDSFFKLLLSEKSRVTVQWGIFLGLIIGAFYFGFQTKDFVNAQTELTKQVKDSTEKVKEISAQFEDFWTYNMQKDYNSYLKNNNPNLVTPSVGDIKVENQNK